MQAGGERGLTWCRTPSHSVPSGPSNRVPGDQSAVDGYLTHFQHLDGARCHCKRATLTSCIKVPTASKWPPKAAMNQTAFCPR